MEKPEIEYSYDDFPNMNFGMASYGEPEETMYCVTTYLKYNQKEVNIGDKLVWYSSFNNNYTLITVNQIRLNPTIRVYDEETGSYYLLRNCSKLKF